MKTFHKTALAIASVAVAISLSGCVTGLSSRKATPNQNYQNYQNYDQQPIPQGIGPVEAPAAEPAPEPFVPPAPSSARSIGVRTTSFFQSVGDKVKDTFHR